MWSPQLITYYITKQVSIMIEGKGLLKDSVAKSLRRYDTQVHPLFKERLEVYGVMENDTDSLTTTRSYSYYPTNQGFHGNRLMNYVFQSMFDQEEPEWGGEVLYVSASSKTIEEDASGGMVMDNLVKEKVLTLSGLDGSPATLRTLVSDSLGHRVASDILGNDLRSSSLGQQVDYFLHEHSLTFPHSDFVIIPTRTLKPDLTMTTKYYPGRDDFRAYCRDTNWIRHLSGICLHRLLTPESMGIRRNLERNSVIPARGKDLLNLQLPYPRANEVALLVLGDVSNFTGSLGNAWLMLYCMALQLSQGGTWAKIPNLYSIRGALFTATWYEIIVVYLYLNVGYPAYVEELHEYHYLPGGFLGVAANITVGLVFLSVVLQNLILLLQGTCRVVKAQAGGDDFAFGLIVQSENRGEVTELIRDHITKYVGPLKEFHVVDLMCETPGKLRDFTFCKKWIELEFLDRSIRLKGHDNIPIVKALLPGAHLPNDEALEQWYSYDSNLRTWESIYGHPQQCDSMRRLFSLIYPSVLPLRRRVVITMLPDGYDVVALGSRFITRKAYEEACKVVDVNIGGLTYLGSLAQKVHYCLKADRLTLRKVRRYGSDVELVMRKSEVRSLHIDQRYQQVGLDDDRELTNSLLKLVSN